MTEFEQKQQQLQTLLQQHRREAMLLRRISSFAWATGGAASYVSTAAVEGRAALLITPRQRYLITNNIEAPRLEQEEKLVAQGWCFQVTPWHQTDTAIADLSWGMLLAADGTYPDALDLSTELARLRTRLTEPEQMRLKALGRDCATALESAARAVRPGQSEHQIAAHIARQAEARGVQALVNLVATDERIFAYRHPLPTDKKLEQYAMLVLGGRRQGLTCGLTRLIHFGPVPADLRRRYQAAAQVSATFFRHTRPGHTLGQIFQHAVDAYAATGFADEWQHHHQGGPVGYEPREYLAFPDSDDMVWEGQAYAWNPSVAGAKAEDTFLVGSKENEIITVTADWPTFTAEVNNQILVQPDILEIT